MSGSHNNETKARGISGLFVSKAHLSRLFDATLNLLYPPCCAGCGQIDTHWCDRCQQDIDAESLTPSVIITQPLAGVASTGIHRHKLKQAVHALKYENERSFADFPLGTRLVERFVQLNWTIDIIVPVPLHINRFRERGYNQSQLLGQTLAKHLMIPIAPEALYRIRDTPPQIGLNAKQRDQNVDGAFVADTHLVSRKHILLIDDVYTTGATMQSCAAAVLLAGAHQVFALTVTVASD